MHWKMSKDCCFCSSDLIGEKAALLKQNSDDWFLLQWHLSTKHPHFTKKKSFLLCFFFFILQVLYSIDKKVLHSWIKIQKMILFCREKRVTYTLLLISKTIQSRSKDVHSAWQYILENQSDRKNKDPNHHWRGKD